MAADRIAPDTKAEWLHQQHGRLLENKVAARLQTLEPYFESAGNRTNAGRSVHQYIEKRRDHLDYAGARAVGLPIGSGEVESGHRHVIHYRLKVAGAWWTFQNADAMFELRTTRANHDRDRYWSHLVKTDRRKKSQPCRSSFLANRARRI